MSSRTVSLVNAPLDLQSLRAGARKELLQALTNTGKDKLMYLDESLNSMLSLTVEVADLKAAGVGSWAKLENPEIFSFEAEQIKAKTVIYMIRASQLFLIDCIAKHKERRQSGGAAGHVVFIVHPGSEEGGCLARNQLGQLDMPIVHISRLNFSFLDDDLCDLDLPGIYGDFHVSQGTWKLSTVAEILSANFRTFTKIFSVGQAAKFVAEQVARKSETQEISDHPAELVLIDRRTDILSVLTSQFCYEAVIAASAPGGIKGGYVELQGGGKMALHSGDEIFREIRGTNFSHLSHFFKHKAELIQNIYKEKESLKEISHLHEYMDKFKATQQLHVLLTAHVNLAKEISDQQQASHSQILEIEDGIMSGRLTAAQVVARLEKMIDFGEKLEPVLKLLCMQSLVSGTGLDKKLKIKMVETYGIEKLPLFDNVDILADNRQNSKFWKVKDAFDLVPENFDPLAESYAGYVPLSVRLVERLERWRDQTEALNLLWGPVLEISQQDEKKSLPSPQRPVEQPVRIICFVGGATYGEINALRKLAEITKRKLLIITTEILNDKSFFTNLAEL